MLNSGEVPNLFPADEYEQIIAAVRPKAKDHGIAEGDRCVLCVWSVCVVCVCARVYVCECMCVWGESFLLLKNYDFSYTVETEAEYGYSNYKYYDFITLFCGGRKRKK